MITNQGQMCHLHSDCRKEHFLLSPSLPLTPLLKWHGDIRSEPHRGGSIVEAKQINLIGPTVLYKLRNGTELKKKKKQNHVIQKGLPRLRGLWRRICSRTPAHYRLSSPRCLHVALPNASSGRSLLALTHDQLIRRSCLFRISAPFGACITRTQMRDEGILRLSVCCAFFSQHDRCTVPTSTEDLFIYLTLTPSTPLS